MLIEDVACSVESLADMTLDLADMFQRNGYEDASIFGHAMEGNMHLVFSQGFRNADDLEQYSNMMQEMCEIVAEKYNGSLKGEHGTGRNVAPYVEMEWGPKANAIMWKVKKLFDPQSILNPGVLMNEDPDVHRKALKPSPLANDIVDACIECGFCESNCPSRDASLSPRQRITVWREINRLSREIKLPDAEMGPMPRDEVKRRLDELTHDYQYLGMETCAADGMCQEKCPVGINTGALIKALRTEAEAADETTAGKMGRSAANWLAANMTSFDAHVPKVGGRGVVNFIKTLLLSSFYSLTGIPWARSNYLLGSFETFCTYCCYLGKYDFRLLLLLSSNVYNPPTLAPQPDRPPSQRCSTLCRASTRSSARAPRAPSPRCCTRPRRRAPCRSGRPTCRRGRRRCRRWRCSTRRPSGISTRTCARSTR